MSLTGCAWISDKEHRETLASVGSVPDDDVDDTLDDTGGGTGGDEGGGDEGGGEEGGGEEGGGTGGDDTADPVDEDGDGFSPPDDCDDADADINPDATDLCDGVDDNCSGDETDAVNAGHYYTDSDGD